MKFIKSVFYFIGLVLVLGGAGMLAWQYFRNKALFAVLLSNSIVKGSIGVLQKMGIATLAIFLGLILLIIGLKIGSAVRRNEKEKRAIQKAKEKEAEEHNRQLKLEAEEARKEAEEARKEAQRLKETTEVVKETSEEELPM